MDQSWENWPLLVPAEMDHHGGGFLERCHDEEEDFLRDILLLQPPEYLSSESDSQSFPHHHSPPPTIVHNNNNNNLAASSTTPRTFILSFDKSTIIPAATPHKPPPPPPLHQHLGTTRRSNSKSNTSPAFSNSKKAGKKSRSDTQSMDHTMAERKRRQDLTHKFIALSATIPGLNKTDKGSILRGAINYVKQLQERVRELENQSKIERVILRKKSDVCANNNVVQDSTTSGETSNNSDRDNCLGGNYCESLLLLLPDVEARKLGKEVVLIEIHCEKENGVELKILDLLENLHLSVTGSSFLPFGNSTLAITIIAQMGDAYMTPVEDLVKNLREVLRSSSSNNNDPY